MFNWLEVRMEVWLKIFAKWQIYFIAKSIRENEMEPRDETEHKYWEDDLSVLEKVTHRDEITFKLNILRANPRNPMVLKGLRHHVVPEFKRVWRDQVPEPLRKGNFPLNKVGRYKDGPYGFYEDFMEAVENVFTNKKVHRWLLDSTPKYNYILATNLAKRSVELLGPKAWLQLFDFPTVPRVEGLGLNIAGARYNTSFENPDHINNQQRLKFCNSLMRTGSSYARSPDLMRNLSEFSVGKLRRNFSQNNELFLPYLVFSTPEGNTMATKTDNWVRVHHNHVLGKLGLTRFSSTEVAQSDMEIHWHNTGWDLWHECYILLFAAWDEGKRYAESLQTVEGNRLVTTWRNGGRFNRVNQFPIDMETIAKLECAREEGMPPIETGDDAQTVTSEFSAKCARVVGSVTNYEETITEYDSGDSLVGLTDDEDQPLLEERTSDIESEQEEAEQAPQPPQPILGVPLPEPEGELSTVIQEARFKKMMGETADDEGMGMAIAAAAVFLVLAFAMS